MLLAAHGWAPAPWALGEPSSSLTESFEEPVSYADAWFTWVMDAFDDASTWRAYLASQPERPPEWERALDETVQWLL